MESRTGLRVKRGPVLDLNLRQQAYNFNLQKLQSAFKGYDAKNSI